MKIYPDKILIQKGFTLIELMITIAIVAILVAIAVPSYTNYVRSSNRTEAQRVLIDIANRQEQYYLDYRRYAADTDELGLGSDYVTEHGYYQIETSSASANVDFTLTATAIGAQSSDTHCATFTLSSDGSRGATNSDCWQ